ncbi:hypothetical protein, partial [Oscillibacter sp. CU971]|uniref:hypothetical protein n=1 Tax=Oscillibacter sp. CU971 TaxID=2780102 RepID=UPI00195DEE71
LIYSAKGPEIAVQKWRLPQKHGSLQNALFDGNRFNSTQDAFLGLFLRPGERQAAAMGQVETAV